MGEAEEEEETHFILFLLPSLSLSPTQPAKSGKVQICRLPFLLLLISSTGKKAAAAAAGEGCCFVLEIPLIP